MKNALVLLLLTTTPAAAHDWCWDPDTRSELSQARAWGRLCFPAMLADVESQRLAANQRNLAATQPTPLQSRIGPGIVIPPRR